MSTRILNVHHNPLGKLPFEVWLTSPAPDGISLLAHFKSEADAYRFAACEAIEERHTAREAALEKALEQTVNEMDLIASQCGRVPIGAKITATQLQMVMGAIEGIASGVRVGLRAALREGGTE